MDVRDISIKYDLTRQAIVNAIKIKRLKATKVNSRWDINEKDMEKYISSRWNRKFSEHKGKKIFSDEFISVSEASKLRGLEKAHIYHAIREGRISFKRVRASYVLKLKDVLKYIPNRKIRKFKKPRNRPK